MAYPNPQHDDQYYLSQCPQYSLYPQEQMQFPEHPSQYPPQNSSWYPTPSGVNPFVKLLFTKRTLVNTSITLNGTPRYTISTVDAAGAITNIKDLRSGVLIATINRRNLRPDSVTIAQFYDGRVLKVKEWLVKSIDGTKWTVQTGITTLTFLSDISNRLLVYQDSNREPVAWFEPAKPAESFSFHIKNGMENIWDLAITAVVYIVHKRLLTDKFLAINDIKTNWSMFRQMTTS